QAGSDPALETDRESILLTWQNLLSQMANGARTVGIALPRYGNLAPIDFEIGPKPLYVVDRMKFLANSSGSNSCWQQLYSSLKQARKPG
ncbi:MAG: hypothetical protein Q8L40_00665, partial [Burkholderiales bacterium]|nr:hypothetical protein [Burkholderiales bacterium]